MNGIGSVTTLVVTGILLVTNVAVAAVWAYAIVDSGLVYPYYERSETHGLLLYGSIQVGIVVWPALMLWAVALLGLLIGRVTNPRDPRAQGPISASRPAHLFATWVSWSVGSFCSVIDLLAFVFLIGPA